MQNAQPFSVDTTSGQCTSKTLDGEPCECEEYSEDYIPGQPGPAKCRECGHGRSKHKGRRTGKGVRSIVEELVTSKFGGLDKLASFKNADKEANEGLRSKSKTAPKKVCGQHNSPQYYTDIVYI